MIIKRLPDAFLILALFALSFSACTFEQLPTPRVEIPDSVSFSGNIIPIFSDQLCNQPGCHFTSGVSPDLTPERAYISLVFGGYVNTSEPETSIIYEKITTGSMKQYADKNDAALIIAWIEQGALNN